MAEQPQPPVAGTFVWNELVSRDVEAAKKFYSALLGWEFQGMDMGPMGTYWLIQAGGAMAGGLMNMPPDAPKHVPSHWMPYVAVPDADAAFAKCGKAAIFPPFDVPDVGRMFALADPSGAMLSLMRPSMGTRKGTPNLEQTKPGHFMWNELVSSNAEKASAFLCDLIGWKASKMPHDAGFEYTLFNVAELPVGGMMPLGKSHPVDTPSHWMGYIAVKDIEAVHKAAQKAGAKVVVPPTDVPKTGRFITVIDPSGAAISFMQPAN
jgi:predicted enzyme related to lactoylglutathione lyase